MCTFVKYTIIELINISSTLQKTMFNVWTRRSGKYDKDIQKIMSEYLKKDVQILYSGAGRVTKGTGKKNFSATESYSLIKG